MMVKMEHVLILLIAAFVIYHLVGSCSCANGLDGVDRFSVGGQTDLIYLNDPTAKNCYNLQGDLTGCCDGAVFDIGSNDKCDEYFTYDEGHNEMIGCVLNSSIISGNYEKFICNTNNVGICSNNSCPSCIDNTYYSINGSPCTDNFETCLKCKSASDITWENASSTNRNLYLGGIEDYKYNGPNPLNYCKDTSKFCDKEQYKCVKNLHNKVNQDINNRGTNCSIDNIKKTIDKNNYVIDGCTYDGINIDQDNQIIDVYLNEKGFCNPNNKTWKCNRDLPPYCSDSRTCTYDIHRKECVCTPPKELKNGNCVCPEKTVPLQDAHGDDAGCGIPTCSNQIPHGTCPIGQSCKPYSVPGIHGVARFEYKCM